MAAFYFETPSCLACTNSIAKGEKGSSKRLKPLCLHSFSPLFLYPFLFWKSYLQSYPIVSLPDAHMRSLPFYPMLNLICIFSILRTKKKKKLECQNAKSSWVGPLWFILTSLCFGFNGASHLWELSIPVGSTRCLAAFSTVLSQGAWYSGCQDKSWFRPAWCSGILRTKPRADTIRTHFTCDLSQPMNWRDFPLLWIKFKTTSQEWKVIAWSHDIQLNTAK